MTQAYCTVDEVKRYGVNGSALTGIPTQTIEDTILAISSEADSAFRSRYNLPLISWGVDVRSNVARIVAYELLVVRGFNPELGADTNIASRAEASRAWFRAVARQEMQADVTQSPPAARYDEPRIITQPKRWGPSTKIVF
jgi:phage gp36-like protein